MLGIGDKVELNYEVVDARNNNSVDLNSKLNNKKVIIKVLRRFGCLVCRYEAMELDVNREVFRKLGVEIVAIGFDSKNASKFLSQDLWNGDLYLDQDRLIYQHFNLPKVKMFTGLKKLMRKQSRSEIKKIKKQVSGDFKGDGFQMGGTFLLDDHQLKYVFMQDDFIKFPDLEELVEICGGDRNDIIHLDKPSCASDACGQQPNIGAMNSLPEVGLTN